MFSCSETIVFIHWSTIQKYSCDVRFVKSHFNSVITLAVTENSTGTGPDIMQKPFTLTWTRTRTGDPISIEIQLKHTTWNSFRTWNIVPQPILLCQGSGPCPSSGAVWNVLYTRMHSSRMRTARTLTGWRTPNPPRMENPPGWRPPQDGFKRFENGLGKKFSDLKFFSLMLAENPIFPWFPWPEKTFKIFPEFPDRWEPWHWPIPFWHKCIS